MGYAGNSAAKHCADSLFFPSAGMAAEQAIVPLPRKSMRRPGNSIHAWKFAAIWQVSVKFYRPDHAAGDNSRCWDLFPFFEKIPDRSI